MNFIYACDIIMSWVIITWYNVLIQKLPFESSLLGMIYLICLVFIFIEILREGTSVLEKGIPVRKAVPKIRNIFVIYLVGGLMIFYPAIYSFVFKMSEFDSFVYYNLAILLAWLVSPIYILELIYRQKSK